MTGTTRCIIGQYVPHARSNEFCSATDLFLYTTATWAFSLTSCIFGTPVWSISWIIAEKITANWVNGSDVYLSAGEKNAMLGNFIDGDIYSDRNLANLRCHMCSRLNWLWTLPFCHRRRVRDLQWELSWVASELTLLHGLHVPNCGKNCHFLNKI